MAVLIEWKNAYSVGIKQIDEQHKKLFAHINNLYSSMTEGKDKQILEALLNDLAEYVYYHFGVEEKYFEEFNYEEKKNHVLQHKMYTDKIKSFQEAHKNNQNFLSFEIIDFLENWILEHVTGEDKKYTKCFNSNGIK